MVGRGNQHKEARSAITAAKEIPLKDNTVIVRCDKPVIVKSGDQIVFLGTFPGY